MERLTKKQKNFADDYLESGNGTQAVLKNYNTTSKNMAGVIASKNIRNDKIREYLKEKAKIVKNTIFELSQTAEQESVKLNACKDIMDRAGYKPVEKSEVEITLPEPILDIEDEIQKNNSNS